MSAKEESMMEAGRALDALVAEHVMQWTRYPTRMHPTDNRTIGGILYCPPGFPHDCGRANVVPHYSTDISDAWEMEERIKELGVEVADAYALAVVDSLNIPLERHREVRFAFLHASPLDRCRAALKALESKQ